MLLISRGLKSTRWDAIFSIIIRLETDKTEDKFTYSLSDSLSSVLLSAKEQK